MQNSGQHVLCIRVRDLGLCKFWKNLDRILVEISVKIVLSRLGAWSVLLQTLARILVKVLVKVFSRNLDLNLGKNSVENLGKNSAKILKVVSESCQSF